MLRLYKLLKPLMDRIDSKHCEDMDRPCMCTRRPCVAIFSSDIVDNIEMLSRAKILRQLLHIFNSDTHFKQ